MQLNEKYLQDYANLPFLVYLQMSNTEEKILLCMYDELLCLFTLIIFDDIRQIQNKRAGAAMLFLKCRVMQKYHIVLGYGDGPR